jgi:hypothetical protein
MKYNYIGNCIILFTAGEHGRIDLSMRLPGTPTLSKLF